MERIAYAPLDAATEIKSKTWRFPCSGILDIAQFESVGSPILTEGGRTGCRSSFASGFTLAPFAWLAPANDSGAPNYNVSSTKEYVLPEDFTIQFYAKLKAGGDTSEGGCFVLTQHESGTTTATYSIRLFLSRGASSYVKSATLIIRTVEGKSTTASNANIPDTLWPDADQWCLVRAECSRSEQKIRVYFDGELAIDYDIPVGSPLPSEETIRIGKDGTSIGFVSLMTGLGSYVAGSYNSMMSEFEIYDGCLSQSPIEPTYTYDLREITSSWWNFSHTDVERIGTTIPAALKTGRLNMGTNVIRKRYHSTSVVAQTSGAKLDASVSLNGGTAIQRTSIDMGLNSIAEDAISNNWLLWNLGYWAPSDGGDFKWAGAQTYTFKSHKRFPVHTKGINAQLALHTDHAQDMRISGAHLYYIPLRGAH